ncbi:heme exporter protein CcmB [Pseudohongiella nitratireducens]|uniref:heme exporter protein CcmB n=1 Tax=Pseudohongiella nitratireducens TaxID=1768907 RepID=UPI0024090A83|nr:heme exporter protein CcmB [Pseudohongiella nitratireducens]MDF1623621.1 heme exporter protein CcmB [Pseudohongiella nitratireducens]|tara:strand:- start:2375 stop:3094 length:720 start_codon:yes stop_codon:yes gene_type:complete
MTDKSPVSVADTQTLTSLGKAFRSTLSRDLLIAFKRRNDILNPVMFFLIVVSLFPLGVSPDPQQLSVIAAGVVWVSALLASMLSLDNLFRADYEDGSLEQLLLSPQPLYFMVLAKNISHWLVSGLPVVLLSPVLAYMLYLPSEAYGTLFISLLIGTPVLSLFGSIGVALTVGLGSRGLILAVIVLPLTTPVLIVGAKAVADVSFGLPVGTHFAILGAMLALALTIAPLASAAALKISVN